jgi:hypothetical protein
MTRTWSETGARGNMRGARAPNSREVEVDGSMKRRGERNDARYLYAQSQHARDHGSGQNGQCATREKTPNVIEVDRAATSCTHLCLNALLPQQLAPTPASFLHLLWAPLGYLT